MLNEKTLLKKIILYIVLLIVFLWFTFPLLYILQISFKNYKDAFAYPPKIFFKPTLTNYMEVILEKNFLHYLKNSLAVSTWTTVIAIAFGVPASYIFVRYNFKLRNILQYWIIIAQMAPEAGIVIPFYIILKNVHLLDTLSGLVIVNLAGYLPYSVWMMRGFIGNVPKSLEEAAFIDGCNRVNVFFKIVLPCLKTGIVAIAILIFTLTWNEFFLVLVLTSRRAKTLPILISGFAMGKDVEWGLMSAAAILVVIPILIIVLLFQKHLIRGLVEGAVKF